MSDAEAFREAAASSERMFWLDGGGARPWSGTRSVLGVLADDDVSLTFDATTRTVTRHCDGAAVPVGDDIFAVLEEQVAADGGDPSVSWVGYFGYACRTDLPGRPADPAAGVPDAVWMRLRNPRSLPAEPPPPSVETSLLAVEPSLLAVEPSLTAVEPSLLVDEPSSFAEYAAAFDEVQRQLRRGNSYEVNLTYRERVESSLDPVSAYLRLRALNPAPYSGFLQHHGVHLLSSSPERFATVDRHRTIEAKPIKGTTPRGTTVAEDEEHRQRLAIDAKYRAENLMIVDLMRNDLSMVCEPGSVSVPSLMDVESYQSVHQLVSTVRGRLRGDVTTIGALRSLFPAGSMTGAPKRRTMAIIDAVESTPRGVYAGAFGWISADGRADLSVVIRTLIARRLEPMTARPPGVTGQPPGVTAQPPQVTGQPPGVTGRQAGWGYELGTGGGITVRSAVEEEYAETRWKAARLRAALHGG